MLMFISKFILLAGVDVVTTYLSWTHVRVVNMLKKKQFVYELFVKNNGMIFLDLENGTRNQVHWLGATKSEPFYW